MCIFHSVDLTLGSWGCRLNDIGGSKLHLSKWEGCVFALPVYPHHTLRDKKKKTHKSVDGL